MENKNRIVSWYAEITGRKDELSEEDVQRAIDASGCGLVIDDTLETLNNIKFYLSSPYTSFDEAPIKQFVDISDNKVLFLDIDVDYTDGEYFESFIQRK